MSLKHLFVSESKELLNETWGHMEKVQEQVRKTPTCQSSDNLDIEINNSKELKPTK